MSFYINQKPLKGNSDYISTVKRLAPTKVPYVEGGQFHADLEARYGKDPVYRAITWLTNQENLTPNIFQIKQAVQSLHQHPMTKIAGTHQSYLCEIVELMEFEGSSDYIVDVKQKSDGELQPVFGGQFYADLVAFMGDQAKVDGALGRLANDPRVSRQVLAALKDANSLRTISPAYQRYIVYQVTGLN